MTTIILNVTSTEGARVQPHLSMLTLTKGVTPGKKPGMHYKVGNDAHKLMAAIADDVST